MASIRNLKKDINFVVSELVIECFTLNLLNPEKNTDNLAEIISESVNMKTFLIKKINNLRNEKSQNKMSQAKLIRTEFRDNVKSLVEKLESVEKA